MLSAGTIPELLTQRAENSATLPAYWLPNQQGGWASIDWATFQQKVHWLADRLAEKGLQKGQAVGIMAGSSLQWELAHLAILLAGGIVVGLDPNERPEHLDHIIVKAQIIGLFIDDAEQLKTIKQSILNQVNFIINFSEDLASETLGSIQQTSTNPKENHLSLKNTNVLDDDIATIIFTSGTTGIPKGIAFTHKQIIYACNKILEAYSGIDQSSHLACWLPLSNLFQRILNLCALISGAQTYFVDNPKNVIHFLPQINPDVFIAVPRFYEKLYGELEKQIDIQSKLVKFLIYFCLNQGENANFIGLLFRKVNCLLLKKFRSLFGNNIRYMVSGSAPMPAWLLKRYFAMDLLVLEAYGISENVLPIAVNRPNDYKFGSVGKVMSGNIIKLAKDNELLVKGPCLFNGYIDNGSQVVNQYEFHATGDYAEIDANGFIYLKGRKSEIFKTSTGRKIAPGAIEATMLQTPGVDQAIIIGENRQFLVAIITLTPHHSEQPSAVVKHLSTHLKSLPSYYSPAGFIVTSYGFSLVRNEITANLKLKRDIIKQNFASSIDQLYMHLENPSSILHKEAIVFNSEISLYKVKRS